MFYRKITSRFKSDFKKIRHNEDIVKEVEEIIIMLEEWIPLPEKNKDHPLQWKYKWLRECHIKPDLLLVYQRSDTELTLYLLRLWSHSEIF